MAVAQSSQFNPAISRIFSLWQTSELLILQSCTDLCNSWTIDRPAPSVHEYWEGYALQRSSDLWIKPTLYSRIDFGVLPPVPLASLWETTVALLRLVSLLCSQCPFCIIFDSSIQSIILAFKCFIWFHFTSDNLRPCYVKQHYLALMAIISYCIYSTSFDSFSLVILRLLLCLIGLTPALWNNCGAMRRPYLQC